MKSFTRIASAVLFLLFINISCKKSIDQDFDPGQFPDLATKISTSVSGFVSDDTGQPVMGASVKAGTATTTTDNYGYFEIKNAMVVKEAAVVTVEYAGYFKGIKTFMATEGKSAFFRVKLLKKSIAGSIQASTGGSVAMPNGLSINFPANAIKIASGGAAYSGTVNVAAQWIDPTSTELNQIMPGDLRGVDVGGYIKGLTTYAMAAVELTGSNGEALQIANGKKAGMTFPLPASILANAPATIPLWYFDEPTGLWKEEGFATKNGNTYVGDVSHFSFWNCDVPANYVLFSVTIITDRNIPLAFTQVKISLVSSPNVFSSGYTDSSGFVSGFVPGNMALKMDVLSTAGCNGILYTQTFTTGNTAYAMGTVTAANPNIPFAEITGTLTNCSGAPVSNGYVMFLLNNQYDRYYVNNLGVYSFSVPLCTAPSPVKIFGVDVETQKHSIIINDTIMGGANIIPAILTCNTSFITYDGKYLLKGFHNRPLYNFPFSDTMELWTMGQNEFAFYWPAAGSVGHPFATDANNTLSWYGPTIAPIIHFLPTHEVLMVFNNGSTPISLYTGTIPTHNYYDSVTRKIYVAWQYNNNTDRAFFDTLTYIGPR